MLASLIASVVSGEASEAFGRARSALLVYAFAGLLALVGIGFLVGAGFVAVADEIGTIATALWFGGGALVLALLILLVHRIVSRVRMRRVAQRRRTEIKAVAGATVLAMLPTLLAGRGRGLALVVAALAALGYAVWRENSKPGDDAPDR